MYVAISRELIDFTRKQIRRMSEVEEAAAPSAHIVVDDTSTPFALQLIWGEHQNLRGQIPDTWLQQLERIRINLVGHDSVQFSLDVKFTRSVYVPHDLSAYNHAPRTIDPTLYPEVMAAMNVMRERTEINRRWIAVRAQVIGFLEQCKSLNEAIKLFPQIRTYVPAEYLARVDKKTEKKVRDTTHVMGSLAKIDTDMLAQSAVLSRLAGSN